MLQMPMVAPDPEHKLRVQPNAYKVPTCDTVDGVSITSSSSVSSECDGLDRPSPYVSAMNDCGFPVAPTKVGDPAQQITRHIDMETVGEGYAYVTCNKKHGAGDGDNASCRGFDFDAIPPGLGSMTEMEGMDDSKLGGQSQDVLQASNSECTTVMLNNLPSRCSPQELLELIDDLGFKDTYDFFHMPMRSNRTQNNGFAFLGFKKASTVNLFSQVAVGVRVRANSAKHLQVCAAHLQGVTSGKAHFICPNGKADVRGQAGGQRVAAQLSPAKVEMSTLASRPSLPGAANDPSFSLDSYRPRLQALLLKKLSAGVVTDEMLAVA